MEEQWPPSGHRGTYEMTVDLKNPDLKYTAEVTVRGQRPNDIATLRWGRRGGANEADLQFRRDLYQAVGAVTVAGGHAEAAMKRVLLVIEGGDVFADVDLTWGALEKRLHAVSSSAHKHAPKLTKVLAWADRRGVKKRRDDVVHAYWWNFNGIGVTRSRFTRKGESYTLYGTLDDLHNAATVIFEYANRLDDLVVSDWPQARLPRTSQ